MLSLHQVRCTQSRVIENGLGRYRRLMSTGSKVRELATKDALRKLLRETAQPVAVVTSYYPFGGIDSDPLNGYTDTKKFHGATLSSFSSIALDPYPLISFSLRIPSRMATSLKQLLQDNKKNECTSPDLIVNLLSSSQSSAATHFARADLYPDPFRITPHTLTKDGLPVLDGALGALTCKLVSCIPLHTLCSPEHQRNMKEEGVVQEEIREEDTSNGGLISELFISRVMRVEAPGVVKPPADPHPLLYHHRKYTTSYPVS